MLILMLATALLVDGAPAASPGAAVSPKPQPRERIEVPVAAVGMPPVTRNEKMVCRKEQLLGSRMYKTVCMSSEEAAERRAMDQNAVRAIQDMSKVGNPP